MCVVFRLICDSVFVGRKHLTSDSEVLTKDLALSNSESFCAANSFQFHFVKELKTNRSEQRNRSNSHWGHKESPG